MAVPSDTRSAVLMDLMYILEQQHGERWMCNLDKKIRACPYKEIAQKHAVSVNYVKGLRSKLMRVGWFLRVAHQVDSEPLDQTL
jgi:hypothetical protein